MTIEIVIKGLTDYSAQKIKQNFIRWLEQEGEEKFCNFCHANKLIGTDTVFYYELDNGLYVSKVEIEEYNDVDEE